jgi:hypothetical protein
MHKNWEGALQHEVWRILIHKGYGENLIHTFVMTEEIHRNVQTKVARANPRNPSFTNQLKRPVRMVMARKSTPS